VPKPIAPKNAPGTSGTNAPVRSVRRRAVVVSDTEVLTVTKQNTLIMRKRKSVWTARKCAQFFSHLAQTCNVQASAKAVGLQHRGAYDLRHSWPEFARAWDAALAQGYARLEALLLQRALEQVDPEAAQDVAQDGHTASGKIDVDLAFRLLAAHAKSVGARAAQKPIREATDAETDAALLHQLQMLKRRNDAQRARADAAQNTPQTAPLG
jgi:hypothetical protein